MTLRFRLTGQQGALSALMDAARKAPRGWIVELKPPTRTLMQNARLWAMLEEVSAQVEWYGRTLSADEWKDVFTASLKQQQVVPGIDGHSFVAIGARTSQMSVEELGDLMELISAFGAERGVAFRFPEDAEGKHVGAS